MGSINEKRWQKNRGFGERQLINHDSDKIKHLHHITYKQCQFYLIYYIPYRLETKAIDVLNWLTKYKLIL